METVHLEKLSLAFFTSGDLDSVCICKLVHWFEMRLSLYDLVSDYIARGLESDTNVL